MRQATGKVNQLGKMVAFPFSLAGPLVWPLAEIGGKLLHCVVP